MESIAEEDSEYMARVFCDIAYALSGSEDGGVASEEAFQRVLSIAEAIPDCDPSLTGSAYGGLADLMVKRGDFAKAEELMTLATERFGRGAKVPPTFLARANNNMGVIRLSQGHLEEAEALFDETIRNLEGSRDEQSIEMATALNGKAFRLFKMDHLDEALSLMERAVSIAEVAGGPESPETAKMMVDLAATLKSVGRTDEAKVHFERAREIYLNANGPEDPGFKMVSSYLEDW